MLSLARLLSRARALALPSALLVAATAIKAAASAAAVASDRGYGLRSHARSREPQRTRAGGGGAQSLARLYTADVVAKRRMTTKKKL